MTAKEKAKQPACGAVYGLGLIGAAVYYIGAATSFLGGVIGFLKALVWPAFLIYDILKYIEIPVIV